MSLLLALVPGGRAADDSALDLDALKGKVVYLDFWASWCEPCRQSFPWMNQLQDELGANGLVVIAVDVDRERAAAEQFLRSYPARFRIVYDPQGTLPEKFAVRGMPTSFLIDRNGQVRFEHQGFFLKDREALTQRIRTAVLAR
jgi:cytochrome c biogenesis protein CcmG, thiol:disulfide interchange protein DsbE